MSTSPNQPAAALMDGFVALAEELLPAGDPFDRHAARSQLLAAARTHLLWSQVVGALEREPAAARLLEPAGFHTSTGLGFERCDAPYLLDEMLLATWQRMDIKGQVDSRRRIASTARTILNDLCALAAGDVVDVPACILWDGPELDANRRLHGAFGSMRWEEFVPPPYLEATPYRGLMLYTALPVEIMDTQSADRIPAFYGSSNVTHRAVDRITTQVRLALLEDGLTEPDDSPYESTSGPPARTALIEISTPWDSGHLHVGTFDEFAARGRIENPNAVEQRLNFYVSHWRPEVDVAARRLAASADPERREDDALVDAVTAWESLLGTNQEIKFRVTASIARLLRSSVAEREALHAELGKIYSVRSKIVHGATDLTIDGADQLHDQRLRATEIGAQTLRMLLGTRRDLLMRKVDARSKRLLLE